MYNSAAFLSVVDRLEPTNLRIWLAAILSSLILLGGREKTVLFKCLGIFCTSSAITCTSNALFCTCNAITCTCNAIICTSSAITCTQKEPLSIKNTVIFKKAISRFLNHYHKFGSVFAFEKKLSKEL